jgi:hypothetical protein
VKVIYTTLEKQIRLAIQRADETNRRIERIELTIAEANEITDVFSKLASRFDSESPGGKHYTHLDYGKKIGSLYGVELHVEARPAFVI